MKPVISDTELSAAKAAGSDEVFRLVVDKTLETIGGELNATTMQQLSAGQITLLAYSFFREEVLDGGFVQLIHNGLGPFIFMNPFARAMREWGEALADEAATAVLHDFSKLIYKGRKLFERYGDELTRDCTDEEFMALFEQYPEFDTLDDAFIEMEEELTHAVVAYVIANIDSFVTL